MASPHTVESTAMTRLSFRDPAGAVYEVDNRIIREVKSHALRHLNRTLSSHAVSRFVRSGSLISTTLLNASDVNGLFNNARDHTFAGYTDERNLVSESQTFLEHEKVPFRSFPYEWAPCMIFEAARLTLDLAEELLAEGMGLKDATPYNILFRGTAPIFVDILSIEERNPLDATWLPFGQFVRNFLIPLAMHRHLAIPLDMLFLTHRDGMEPDEAYPMCGFRR